MHWLDRYGTNYHKWQLLSNTTLETWYRPIGPVEAMFDTDGKDLEGRADINTLLEAELSTNVRTEVLRRQILLAWTVLRSQHVFLSAQALCRNDLLSAEKGSSNDRFFVVSKPRDLDEMVEEASRTVDFVENHYSPVDVEDFYTHVMNTARVFDSSNNLARLFILPLQRLPDGRSRFSAVSVVAHEIADALSIYRWHAHFLDLLNTPASALEAQALQLCSASTDLQSHLPQAQEDLYPPISGNKARQRWFWAISRILRHVRRPPPPSFPNPLRRKKPLKAAEAMPIHYPALLDYSRSPPLNTYSATASLSPHATSRIRSLCRSANVSIGAGAFALVALVMMILHEEEEEERQQQQQQQQERSFVTATSLNPTISIPSPPQPHPQQSLSSLPFVSSFPLNPRPFLTRPTPPTGSESSLVLSFSDGLTLPFLPSTLPLEARFRLLARQAHRQLRIYQKRKQAAPADQEALELGSRGPGQMLPQLYLYTMERAGWDVQGRYPSRIAGGSARWNALGATCGVSSVGDRSALIAPLHNNHPHHHTRLKLGNTSKDGGAESENAHAPDPEADAEKDGEYASFNFIDIRCTVRARTGEFLIGSAGAEHGLGFNVSFDGCAIERGRVEGEWTKLVEGLFEDGGKGKGKGKGKRKGRMAKL